MSNFQESDVEKFKNVVFLAHSVLENAYIYIDRAPAIISISEWIIWADSEIKKLVKLLTTINFEAPVDLDMFLDEEDVKELMRIFKEYE